MNKTTFGKNVYAIGGNVNAAKVSGINVVRTSSSCTPSRGRSTALGGVLEASRTGGATNNYGNMYELDAIASCVVGGVSVTGGIGTIPGIVVGVLIFGVINYGLTFIGVNPYMAADPQGGHHRRGRGLRRPEVRRQEVGSSRTGSRPPGGVRPPVRKRRKQAKCLHSLDFSVRWPAR